ncbi:hypothetical protein ARMGADRAFT_1039590 [Armillaria gallica]|uniref:Uncharacterized protein n=1 Tax=Armillaria gallica TaxID=47427 RepID=A0A2H3CDD7_ARMGA|nr:hypothetical protein ARMGADRAFT_1039590 [Armillaria gallica]
MSFVLNKIPCHSPQMLLEADVPKSLTEGIVDTSFENVVSFLDASDSRNKGLHNVVNENKFEYHQTVQTISTAVQLQQVRSSTKYPTGSHSRRTSNVEHKVVPVTEGVQLILQYDVFVPQEKDDSHDFNDSSNLDKAIQEIITSGMEEVGFLLHHLYCRASIHIEYLKGANAIIYARLSQVFDVSLIPVILEEISMDTEWAGQEMAVYKAFKKGAVGGHMRKKAKISTKFHLSLVSDVMEISSEDYIKRTGNEVQEAECHYFGGGMFIREKRLEAQVI